MDYDSLLTTVASRLNRDDLTTDIPDFVSRAEDEIHAKLATSPVRPMVKTYSTTTSEQALTVPSDFIDAINLTLSDGTDTWQVVRIRPEDPSDYYATRALPYRTEPDASRIFHYTIIGTNLTLSALPDSSLSVSLIYYAKPDRLTSSTTSNWVMASHADVYEFGTLAHAYRHIMDDGREDRYVEKFIGAMDLMLAAYPETGQPSELRASDLPTVIQTWNINSDS